MLNISAVAFAQKRPRHAEKAHASVFSQLKIDEKKKKTIYKNKVQSLSPIMFFGVFFTFVFVGLSALQQCLPAGRTPKLEEHEDLQHNMH